MSTCLFAADLHGRLSRYESLFSAVARDRPTGLFLGGDLLPPAALGSLAGPDAPDDFLRDYLGPRLHRLRTELGDAYPRVFAILGNDDPAAELPAVHEIEAESLWTYAHDRTTAFGPYTVTGYSFVPPTPFALKDWERYDTSRYVDPGCVSPEEGVRSVDRPEAEARWTTIAGDLERLRAGLHPSKAIFLFHSPPYRTRLDRADLDGRVVDHVPLDVHVGSIAIRRFVETWQPRLTLHGHIHESARLTGSWQDRIGDTILLSGAHDGAELALVRFDPDHPERAARELI
ncbi:MAG: metallophosphoesterase [bacterium]